MCPSSLLTSRFGTVAAAKLWRQFRRGANLVPSAVPHPKGAASSVDVDGTACHRSDTSRRLTLSLHRRYAAAVRSSTWAVCEAKFPAASSIGAASARLRAHAVLLLALSSVAAAVPAAEPSSTDAAAAGRSLTWSGLHRARYARLWNQFRPGLRGDDHVLELRTALRAAYDAGRVTLVGDLQDARAYLTDEQSGVSTAIVNTFELVQAYAEVGGADGERGTRVRAGRFLLELGSGRLVAAEQYRNVARAFV